MASQIDLPPVPLPLDADEFLESMAAEWKGLYLLGTLNRHITVHSQQRRAINLIKALMESGGGLDGKSVAIVGAGFAGLTAAAFALENTTALVSLFDAASRPLWLQDNCHNRWLHPGIYDWPYPGSLEPCTALPVLNWRAGAASDVAMRVRAQWEHIAAAKGLLSVRLNTKVTAVIKASDGRFLLRVDEREEPFDIVILAVGFGLESDERGRVAYWNDSDGLDGISAGAEVLVCGFGDGGLADVLRLCLPDIRQDSLIELVRHVPANIRRDLIEWDYYLYTNGDALDERYRGLRVEPIVQRIVDARPPVAKVTLAGKGNLYAPGSAILNRFLVSQLYQARGEDAFRFANAVSPGSLEERPDGRWSMQVGTDAKPRQFDQIVFRFGPKPVYQHVSPLNHWEVGAERRKRWRELPQSLDRTRLPLKGKGETQDAAEVRPDFLAYESSSRRWCLVLQSPGSSINLAVFATHALEEEGTGITNLNLQPLVLSSLDAFGSEDGKADPATLRSAVRALCAADIVITDVTDYDPGILLLLGIRAAVRRSVTIACTGQPLTPEIWDKLPFNLREINLVSFYNQDNGYKELREALLAGLTQGGQSARYLDLPVYDYVRDAPPVDAAGASPRVLLLRAFTTYDGARKIHVQHRIREGLGLTKEARVEAVIDQKSPRLAGQRLYEAIRHWNTCVADLTWWRPNVMFELGVRLAVQPSGTHCLIDQTVEGTATFQGVRSPLKDFLRPFSYDLTSTSFSAAFAPNPNASVVFDTAARHFRTNQDHYHERADTVLEAAVQAVTGNDFDSLEKVDLIKSLYASDNRTYGEEIRYSVFERLCAAWYYLAERDQPYAVKPIDLLDRNRAKAFRRFFRLGSLLKNVLTRYGPGDGRARDRIAETEKVARESGAETMADLLDAWHDFRNDPPWRIVGSQLEAEERHDLIDQYEDQFQQLAELEKRLVALANPVCDLPLQGVRFDLRRGRIALRQLGGNNVD